MKALRLVRRIHSHDTNTLRNKKHKAFWSDKIAPIVLAVVSLWMANLTLAHPGLHHDIERLTEGLVREPKRADLWIERSHYYRLDGQFENALSDLEFAHSLDPSRIDISAHRGMVLSELGRLEEAEKALTDFLQNSDGSPTAFAERAKIRATTNRRELAVADYLSALKLHPDVELYVECGRIQESLGWFEQAASLYREASQVLGEAETIRIALIRVEIQLKEFNNALRLVDEAASTAPVKTSWFLQRAQIQLLAENKEAAFIEIERALVEADRVLALRPSAIHLVSRAEVYVAMGRPAEARRDLVAAIEKSPRYARASELLAQLGNEKN